MNKQKGYIDETLQTLFGLSLIVAIIALPISLKQTSKHADEAVLQAIQAGADPLAAKCALQGGGGSAECIISAMYKGKKQ